MKIEAVITEVKTFLIQTFGVIDTWFDKEEATRTYKPVNGGWTANEILEHIGLTNHFLLILIDKGTTKALQNIHKLNLAAELENYTFHKDKLEEIGQHLSFTWIRPEHMEPTGTRPLAEVRQLLKAQVDQCLENLEKMKNGEGVLYKTTMTVNALGKIDVYEYIYFLAQHGQRHITQMEKNEAEFKANG